MTKTCSTAGCVKLAKPGRTVCSMHHGRIYRHGDPNVVKNNYGKPVSERLVGVEVGECLVWTGHTVRGYGALRWKGKEWYVHRLVWTLANGPIPDGIHICHRCDNPPCFRLDHLFSGTNQDNVDDKVSKGRARGGRPRGAHRKHEA